MCTFDKAIVYSSGSLHTYNQPAVIEWLVQIALKRFQRFRVPIKLFNVTWYLSKNVSLQNPGSDGIEYIVY